MFLAAQDNVGTQGVHSASPLVVLQPRLSLSKHAAPVHAICRTRIIADIFKQSAVHRTNKPVQTEGLAGWQFVASLLAVGFCVGQAAMVGGF